MAISTVNGKQDILIGFPNSAVIAFGNGGGTFAVNEFILEKFRANVPSPLPNAMTALFGNPIRMSCFHHR